MRFEPVNRYTAKTETVFALLDLFNQNIVDNSRVLGHGCLQQSSVTYCCRKVSKHFIDHSPWKMMC